jgi:DNA-binding transcriptional LysR family regulator
MLTLRQFQQFLAVAEAMSFRRAAERLAMAQPPLTAAIRQIEEALGVRLFERTNRITALTAAGQVLQDEARRTITQAERAVMLTRRAGAGVVGSLRIGFVASAVRRLVPTLVADFRATHPDVALELTEAPTARQAAALLEDRQDVGVVVLPLPAGFERRIVTHTLTSGRLVAAIPRRRALAAEPDVPLPLAALANEPWVLFPAVEGPGLHAAILAACAKAGFMPRVAQHAVQMETIVGLVAAGLGVALVPSLFGDERRDGVVFRALAGAGSPIPYELALAWRAGDNSPALMALLASSGVQAR